MFGKGGVAWSAWALRTAEASVDYRQHLSTFPNPLVLLLKLCGLLWVKRYGQAGLAGSSLSMWFLRACYTVLFLVSVPRVKQRPDLQRAHCEIILCQQRLLYITREASSPSAAGSPGPPSQPDGHCQLYIFSLLVSFSPLKTVLSGLAAGSTGLSCLPFPSPSGQSQSFLRGCELIVLLPEISLDGHSFGFLVL